jgi:hypothetical protein
MRWAASRFVRNLRGMPSGDDPDDLALNPIEEAVRTHDNLPIREIWELGNPSSGIRKALEATEPSLRLTAKGYRGRRVLVTYVPELF